MRSVMYWRCILRKKISFAQRFILLESDHYGVCLEDLFHFEIYKSIGTYKRSPFWSVSAFVGILVQSFTNGDNMVSNSGPYFCEFSLKNIIFIWCCKIFKIYQFIYRIYHLIFRLVVIWLSCHMFCI